MPSPFPGMDPYLENPIRWGDFHTSFLGPLRFQLNKLLPRPYIARFDRYVWVDEPDASQLRLLGEPDTYGADPLGERPSAAKTAALAAPVSTTLPALAHKGKLFVKIMDAMNHRIVTVIELLSPANKSSGRDGDAYLAKREEYLSAGVNLVEMDLLRGGNRPPTATPVPRADYYITVSRAIDFPTAGLWPLTVRDPLPTIPVPLRPEDPAVMLALQPVFTEAYDGGRYSEEINYDEPPVPPLGEPDATWARDLLSRRTRQVTE